MKKIEWKKLFPFLCEKVLKWVKTFKKKPPVPLLDERMLDERMLDERTRQRLSSGFDWDNYIQWDDEYMLCLLEWHYLSFAFKWYALAKLKVLIGFSLY